MYLSKYLLIAIDELWYTLLRSFLYRLFGKIFQLYIYKNCNLQLTSKVPHSFCIYHFWKHQQSSLKRRWQTSGATDEQIYQFQCYDTQTPYIKNLLPFFKWVVAPKNWSKVSESEISYLGGCKKLDGILQIPPKNIPDIYKYYISPPSVTIVQNTLLILSI